MIFIKINYIKKGENDMSYMFQTRIVEENIIDAEFEEITNPVPVTVSKIRIFSNRILNSYFSFCEKCIQKGIAFKNWIVNKFKKHKELYFFILWILFCYGWKVFLCWLWWG